jgi:metal-responsive CopG/Arc/MetJ family transcriptional regulator
MATETIRTHVVLPKELVEAVDRIVGQRRRSQFLTDAVREKLDREHRTKALREAAGSIDLADYPDWQTPEETSAWVRSLRAEADRSLPRRGRARASG